MEFVPSSLSKPMLYLIAKEHGTKVILYIATLIMIITVLARFNKLSSKYYFEYKRFHSKSTKLLKYREIVILKNTPLFSNKTAFKLQIIPNIGIVVYNGTKKKQTIYYAYLKGINIVEYLSNGIKVNYKIIALESKHNIDSKSNLITETTLLDNNEIGVPLKIIKDIYNLVQEP